MCEMGAQDCNAIYAVPLPGHWLLHAPLHRTTALCDGRFLDDLAKLPQLPSASGRFGRLLGALSRRPLRPPAGRTGPLRPAFLGLVPTRGCNMACRYCGFGSAQSGHQTISEVLAGQAVEWMGEMARTAGDRGLAVDFFGGEPMAAARIVRAAVRRAQDVAGRSGLATRFELATNGCFGDDDRRFVRDNFDHVMLSLDGPQEIQDLHRPLRGGAGSFELVAETARALSGGRVELCIRMCATGESLARLASDIAWVCGAIRPASVHVEPLRPNVETAHAGFTPPDPWAFVRAMRDAGPAADAAGVRLICASAQVDRILDAFCPLGKDVPIIDAEGRVSACYMLAEDWKAVGLDLDLGSMDDGAAAPALDAGAVARVRGLSHPPADCETCFCRWHCAGGCLVNMYGRGRKSDGNEFCIRTRLQCALALLDTLGRGDLAGSLVKDQGAMERLALRNSDVVEGPREEGL